MLVNCNEKAEATWHWSACILTCRFHKITKLCRLTSTITSRRNTTSRILDLAMREGSCVDKNEEKSVLYESYVDQNEEKRAPFIDLHLVSVSFSFGNSIFSVANILSLIIRH